MDVVLSEIVIAEISDTGCVELVYRSGTRAFLLPEKLRKLFNALYEDEEYDRAMEARHHRDSGKGV